jgi:hypothetical protein
MTCIAWKELLSKHSIKINYKAAISSEGLSIFAKYIPGKLFVVLGRASYLSIGGNSLKMATFLSLKSQLILVWSGLIIGVIPLFYFNGNAELKSLSIIAILLISLFLFSKSVHNIIIKIISSVFHREIELPIVDFQKVSTAISLYVIRWLCISVAFFFLLKSMYHESTLIHSFVFPLSASIGILAIVFPAGIGVREGVMIGYLSLMGVPIKIATSVSVLSRLWFIGGEVFIFILGIVMDRLNKKVA